MSFLRFIENQSYLPVRIKIIVGQTFNRNAFNRIIGGGGNFLDQYLSQFTIGFDDGKDRRGLCGEPFLQPRFYFFRRETVCGGFPKKPVDNNFERVRFSFGVRFSADVNAASFFEFDQIFFGEFAVSGGDGILMNLKTAGDFAGAGKFFACFEVAAQDSERDLRDDLFADGNFRIFRQPDFNR